MQEEQRHRTLAAFQEFLTTPLEAQLERHQNTSPESAALALFHDVAAVPAYKAFLTEHGINPASIQTFKDFQKLPLITKENYLLRHPLADLCRNGQLEMCDIIAVSSGSTGKPTFWHRFLTDELQIATRFEQIFHDSFYADTRRTLAVICFTLGTWVGGIYTTNCCRYLASKGQAPLHTQRVASKSSTMGDNVFVYPLMPQPLLDSDELVIPDISHIVTEDDAPVDNFQSEKQQRLLVEPLYSSWSPEVPFVAAANVGLFYALKQDPIVPDAFVSLRVQMPQDWSQKQHRSYFVWEFGKVPEVCIEIVSNRKGDELGGKKELYAQIGVTYYAVFDPLQQIQEAKQMNGELLRVWALVAGRYVELSPPLWLETVSLGLRLWSGAFEEQTRLWLRWCNQSEQIIPTGAERAQQESQRANLEQQRAERLAERLRAMGIDPMEI